MVNQKEGGSKDLQKNNIFSYRFDEWCGIIHSNFAEAKIEREQAKDAA